MGEMGSQSRSLCQILVKYCQHSSSHTFLNMLRMIVLMISGSSSNMGEMGSKSRSLGQILEKSCQNSSGHSFDPIFPKLAQNVCLDLIWFKFEHGWDGVNKKVTRSNLSQHQLSLMSYFTQDFQASRVSFLCQDLSSHTNIFT